MSLTQLDWKQAFEVIYRNGVGRYEKGASTPAATFTPEEVSALATFGCSAQELFDYVEDFCRFGEPSYEDALAVTGIRRDYFLKVQGGKPSGKQISMATLPSKTAAVAGIPWLPRIIEKAKAKLRGEMPPELMYGCGGDRAFLEGVRMQLPEFLQLVWSKWDDSQGIIDQVVRSKSSR